MCQGDAMDCLADGRTNAYKYFNKLALKNPEQPIFEKIAEFTTPIKELYLCRSIMSVSGHCYEKLN